MRPTTASPGRSFAIVAIAAAVTGAFSWGDAILQFFVSSGGGFLLGLAIAWVIGQARVGLKRFCVDDPTIQLYISAPAVSGMQEARTFVPE